ncbi:Ribonucleoside-diphosphate reductase subunit alpha [Mycoplasmopsis californica]|uniref:Ribonucleoside-diphosphate reductase n=1 Tax=Mycoplasmopsis equigenitalium TaxID=114883 RepID=A0ABY5J120_9BACT|nr:class 1b ribonucleoside-diphosphate reductase subunit alpha [Mycoplasmopsis equigenitalium]UUD36675.1 class 1b ribonucleoside-diphosphate reductase subunit alpha [Mycoplasmopsis equigenitalium]VEU69363.1 Ribonucleoside-diphosphate reductase subunit alpha [Mycoplasmopsis californica]
MSSKLMKEDDEYITLNAIASMKINGKYHFESDKESVKQYMKHHVLPKMKKFESEQDRLFYLVENHYYEPEWIAKYGTEKVVELIEYAKSFNHKFPGFMGAFKFFSTYCLKSFNEQEYLETYEHRVVMNALVLGDGNFERAHNLVKDMMLGRFQPATPTFLNAGKKQRGEFVSCYLLRVEDNMESIARGISTSLQLSKRAGGVALCLTNLREFGAPIKNLENQATGLIPVMKLLEDSFSYANQLGQRPGAGAVYINVHHPDVMSFLDTKRENADEKIRIKSLSLGLVVPDITFELAKNNEEMALFSPYDVQKEYGKSFSDISITQEYHNLVKNPRIKKTYINARKIFQTIAELQFESGYPYILFDDTVNNRNPHPGRIVMSNLCSEIAQPSTESTFNQDLTFKTIGKDISCNLGSLNIAYMMESADDFSNVVERAIRALDVVSRQADLDSAPSVKNGNEANHALGLGAMNMHGFLATNGVYYDSPEALDFTNIFFYTVAYYAYKASNKMVSEFGKFKGFSESQYANGKYLEKYTKCDEDEYLPKTNKVKHIFEKANIHIPTQAEWIALSKKIMKEGLANSHLMAIAPTGSISYLSSCTPSLQPVVAPVEIRKEGKVGRVYVPAFKITNTNLPYYEKGAYELGPNPIIDLVAEAQKHVDQAISLTLFMTDKATTRDLNKAYIRAFTKKCSSIYYVRLRQEVLEGSENLECETCMI